ncbi:MAG: hypothetical protein EXQ91_00665 [Alphaproteobacteria bacterium]|nr:hypothetical protein [Alphaproteobacteria bacterium]
MHESILVYRHFRYLKWAVTLTVVAILAYVFHTPGEPANGGTWLGYTLGGIGAGLIFWLAWFGMRKRDYAKPTGKLEDWLSAHIYLGLSLIFIATLHSGFQFGWNVHTLAYVLMMLVIASGAFGLYAYIRYPRLMTDNRRGTTLDAMIVEMAEADREIRELAAKMSDEIRDLVFDAIDNTTIGGGVRRQLEPGRSGRTVAAIDKVRSAFASGARDQTETSRRLISLLTRKNELVVRARNDVMYKAMMDVWLYVHVPLSFALLVALVAHVIAVFFYW